MKQWAGLAGLWWLMASAVHPAAVQTGTRPWPKATVAYHFDSELLKAVGTKRQDCLGYLKWPAGAQAFKACKAMDAWHWATGVVFVADGGRLDSLAIQASHGDGTFATLGHLPLGNHMKIEAGATYGSVLHEFGHVLGLQHEHQRPDRDQYLTLTPFLQDDLDHCGLKFTAVCNDVRVAFPVVAMQMTSDYDPCSLMHYLSNQTPRHREDPRWGHIFTLTAKGEAALTACLPQFAKLPERCRKVGQKCAISHMDAALVSRFQGTVGH